MSKLFRSIWLLGLLVFFGAQLAATSIPIASAIQFVPDYDGQNWVSIAYDGTSLLDFTYDSGAVPIADSEGNVAEGTSSLFGKTAEFLAADSVSYGNLASSATINHRCDGSCSWQV